MDPIAERRMELRTATGPVEVVVVIARPTLDASLDSWKCEYEIRFGSSTKPMAMHGSDAMQALQLSMAILDVELEFGAKKHKGELWCLHEPFTSVLKNSGLQSVHATDESSRGAT
jgi:hypothetical protein